MGTGVGLYHRAQRWPRRGDLPLAPASVTAVDDDGNLADPAAADTVLASAGFLRANEWEAQNVTCRVWATSVYRIADLGEFPVPLVELRER